MPDLPAKDRWPRIVLGVLVIAAAVIVGLVIVLTRDDANDTAVGGTDGGTGCAEVEAPEARGPETREAPTEPLDANPKWALVVETTCGSFTIALDPEQAPKTTASLVVLAGDGYFDDTTFHRVVPGFVVQGGDPTGSGAGGPGYTTVDVPGDGSRYVRGVVAMAKAGNEPRGAAGSQFFVVTAEDAGLPPDYAIVGEVIEGMDTIDRIEALGVGDGPPSRPIVITSVTIRRSG